MVLGIALSSIGILARDLLEGELGHAFGRRKVQRQISKLSNHYIVCGFGRMGAAVCKELAAKPVDFVVIDRSVELVDQAEAEGYLGLVADVTKDEDVVFGEVGIEKARGLVTALSKDSDNVLRRALRTWAQSETEDCCSSAEDEIERTETPASWGVLCCSAPTRSVDTE